MEKFDLRKIKSYSVSDCSKVMNIFTDVNCKHTCLAWKHSLIHLEKCSSSSKSQILELLLFKLHTGMKIWLQRTNKKANFRPEMILFLFGRQLSYLLSSVGKQQRVLERGIRSYSLVTLTMTVGTTNLQQTSRL